MNLTSQNKNIITVNGIAKSGKSRQSGELFMSNVSTPNNDTANDIPSKQLNFFKFHGFSVSIPVTIPEAIDIRINGLRKNVITLITNMK